MNTTLENEILTRLENIEKILLLSTPRRKLTPDMRKRAVELDDGPVAHRAGGERDECLRVEFERLACMDPTKRKTLKFPQSIVPKWNVTADGDMHFEPLGIVPYSILVNRCEHRKAFRPHAGEVDARTVVEDLLAASDFIVTTLHDMHLVKGSAVRVVVGPDEAVRLGLRSARAKSKDPAPKFDMEAFRAVADEAPELEILEPETDPPTILDAAAFAALGDDDDDLLEGERALLETEEPVVETRKPLKINVKLSGK